MGPKKRLMFVFGTRPEAIKMAPLIEHAAQYDEVFERMVVVTAQHRDMLDQVLKLFNIQPDYDLDIMEHAQGLTTIMTKAMQGLEEILLREKPDMLLVQGDTTTTFIASLMAYTYRVPIAHVEAGLRTFDKYRPFPEEMNRRMTTVLTDIHFAPTKRSVFNLLKEGVTPNTIFLTGNTVIDALLEVAARPFDIRSLGIDAKDNPLVLVTAHRRESFGAPMRQICEAVRRLVASRRGEITVVFPAHKNPQVQDVVNEILGGLPEVMIMEPLDYEPFVHVMKAATLILTDSGGVQEEAPSLGKPVLVMREVTERPEAVSAGTVKLVGMDTERIVAEAEKLLTDKNEYEKMARAINPYGDGKASRRIFAYLLRHFGYTDRRIEEFNAEGAVATEGNTCGTAAS